MKKNLLTIFVLACILSSCKTDNIELKTETTPDATILENYNNTGVNFRIENAGLTRTGCLEIYYVEAEIPDDTLVLEGVITVELDTTGNRKVSLYETADYLPDDVFIGSYTVDELLRIIDAQVGEEISAGGVDLHARRPGESNWGCIRREYKDMVDALQSRPLDDVGCDMIGGGICKALALIAAAVECDKKTYSL